MSASVPQHNYEEVDLAPALTTVTVTITNGTSLSAAVDIGNAGIVRVLMPATWTAAVLTAQVSQDNATFYDLYNADGTEWSATVAANHAVVMDVTVWTGMRYVKLRSGTGGAAVNQGGDRILTLVTRAL
jgi:hypothetical protein